jgi:superfamily II DNA or RNA helicase
MDNQIENYFKYNNPEYIKDINKIYKKILYEYCTRLTIFYENIDYDTYVKIFKLIKLLDPFDINLINPINKDILTELQLTCIEYFHYIDSLLIALPTGSGKTIIAMCCAIYFMRESKNNKVLVLSPASVINNFEKEANKFGFTFKQNNRIKFYSFDQYLHDSKFSENTSYEFNCKNTLLIIDEVHSLKGRGSKYIYLMKCAAKAKKVLLMSATPIINTTEDIIPIINFIKKNYIIGTNRVEKRQRAPFKYEYEISYSRDPYVRIAKQLRELDKFKYLLNYHVIYKSKDIIYDDNFPRYKINKIYINMDKEYYKIFYKYVDKEGLNELRKQGLEPLFKKPEKFYNGYRRAVNKLQGYYYSIKMNNILNKIESGQSIIYSNWLEYGSNIIENILYKNNINYGIIKGDTSLKQRTKLMKQYNNKDIKVMVITKAGSEGLDFKNTENLIVIDPTWGFSQTQQVIGRAVRYKSHINLPLNKRFVNIYFLLAIGPDETPDTPIELTRSGDLILYYISEYKEDMITSSNLILNKISDETIFMYKNE